MTKAMNEFNAKPAADHFMANLHDDDPTSLFVIRWDNQHFTKLREFLKFTKRYASLMQFMGPDYADEDISEYFSEPPSLDWSTEYDFKTFPPQSKDLKQILSELYPDVEIPWLAEGDHTKTMAIGIDDDYKFVSQGPKGFANAFVAHDVDFEY